MTSVDQLSDPYAAPGALTPAGATPIVRLLGIHKYFGSNHVLRGCSLEVYPSETICIIGRSGSGKSTILRLLLGLVRVDSGSILVDGEDLTRLGTARLRAVRQRFGMLFQQGALFDSMTVGENVGYTLLDEERDEEDRVEGAVRTYLSLVGLDPNLIDRMPDQLSGGMQRRVAIARALASREPEILLYDEPTTGLDPQSAERITDLIVRLRDTMGKTSIMVTHDIPDAFKVSDRITVLNEGRVMFEGTPRELTGCSIPFVAEFIAPFRSSMEAAVRRLGSASPPAHPRGAGGHA